MKSVVQNINGSRATEAIDSNTHKYHINITFRVPWGSILGTILFLTCTNDIISSNNKLKFILYADDTDIFI